MLNKELCKRCWEHGKADNLNGFGWAQIDEEDWKNKKIVVCSLRYAALLPHPTIIKTTEPPPDNCPYLLEHIVDVK